MLTSADFQKQELRVTRQKAKRAKNSKGKQEARRGFTRLGDVAQPYGWELPGQRLLNGSCLGFFVVPRYVLSIASECQLQFCYICSAGRL